MFSNAVVTKQAARQARADHKIARQASHMARPGASEQQAADDQQVMNEMRHNKAALGINRAMLDYDREHQDGASGS